MDKSLVDIINIIAGTGTWIRFLFILISFLLGTFIIFRSGTEKSQSNTIEAQKKELEIKNNRIETLVNEVKKADDKATLCERENIVLKSRTDLGAVIQILATMTEAHNREHTDKIVYLQKIMQANEQILKEVLHNTKNKNQRRPRT